MTVYLDNKKYAVLQTIKIKNQDLTITQNGVYYPDEGYTGFGTVKVNVPEPVFEEITVTPSLVLQEILPSQGKDGISKVTVNPISSALDTDLKAENIRDGIDIFGVTGNLIEANLTTRDIYSNGTYIPETPYNGFSQVDVDIKANNKELHITPAIEQQIFLAEDEYMGYSPVIVDPISSAEPDLIPENIKEGVEVFGVVGTCVESVTQEKEVIPSAVAQEVIPDGGFTGLSKVTVAAVDNIADPDLIPENVKKGIDIFGVVGTLESILPQIPLNIVVDETTETVTNYLPEQETYEGYSEVSLDLTWIENELKALNGADDAPPQPEPQTPDITGLNSLIEQATQLLGSATVSSDGSDVPTNQYWVPQTYNVELGDAISRAITLKNQGESADYQAVEDSKSELKSKMEAFNNAKKNGTKSEDISLEVKDIAQNAESRGVFTVSTTTTYTLAMCGEGCLFSGTLAGGSGAAWKGTVQLPAGTYNYAVYGPRGLSMNTVFEDTNGTFKISVPGGGTGVYEGAVQITDTNSWIQSEILNKSAVSGTPVSQLGNGYGKGAESEAQNSSATSGYLSLTPV